ncbi:MAG TPA: hypothetical protein VII13_02895 [Vicinamibacteria bacterium]|jgi:hypothetical protein
MLRTRLAFLFALLALAGVAGADGVASFAPHTDDGCQTEVHCVACRTAFVRPAVVATPLAAVYNLSPLETVAVAPPSAVAAPAVSRRRPRGPPLSS